MMNMKRSLRIIALSVAVVATAGCSTTEILGLGAAGIAGVMSSGSANPDYTKYAETCRAIIGDFVAVKTQQNNAITAGIQSNDAGVRGGAMVLLALSTRDTPNMMQTCVINGPESFLQTIFKNTNVAGILLALYQENRADSRSQRQIHIQKELGLANIENSQITAKQQTDLIRDLVSGSSANFEAGVNAGANLGN